jgi:hypothetical protein
LDSQVLKLFVLHRAIEIKALNVQLGKDLLSAYDKLIDCDCSFKVLKGVTPPLFNTFKK